MSSNSSTARLILLGGVFLLAAGAALAVANVLWGAKFKRNSLCRAYKVDQPFSIKDFSRRARKRGREPVITIETAGTARTILAPLPDDPEPATDLSGSATVNFGGRDERVVCTVRFDKGRVAKILTEQPE